MFPTGSVATDVAQVFGDAERMIWRIVSGLGAIGIVQVTRVTYGEGRLWHTETQSRPIIMR